MKRRIIVWWRILLWGLLIVPGSFQLLAQVYLTKDEALKLYFPGLNIERKTLFLTDEQVQSIEKAGRAKLESKVVTYYVGKLNEGIAGYAFFETQVVRTMPETFMVVLNGDGTVRAVELLAFFEPEDYRPPERWLGQFEAKSLKDDLWLKRGIPNIIGATLTAQSITEGVRRVLAMYQTAVQGGSSQ